MLTPLRNFDTHEALPLSHRSHVNSFPDLTAETLPAKNLNSRTLPYTIVPHHNISLFIDQSNAVFSLCELQ
jgi:hypothetical protein